jgi:hypothetical protein
MAMFRRLCGSVEVAITDRLGIDRSVQLERGRPETRSL